MTNLNDRNEADPLALDPADAFDVDEHRVLVVIDKPTPELRKRVLSLAQKNGLKLEPDVPLDPHLSLDDGHDRNGRPSDVRDLVPAARQFVSKINQTDRLYWFVGDKARTRAATIAWDEGIRLSPVFVGTSGRNTLVSRYGIDPFNLFVRPNTDTEHDALRPYGIQIRPNQAIDGWERGKLRVLEPRNHHQPAHIDFPALATQTAHLARLSFQTYPLLSMLAAAQELEPEYADLTTQWNLQPDRLNARVMWNLAPVSPAPIPGVAVFVVDTGVNYDPTNAIDVVLDGRSTNIDASGGSVWTGNGRPVSPTTTYHGTFNAAVIGAKSDHLHMAGLWPESKIVSLRCNGASPTHIWWSMKYLLQRIGTDGGVVIMGFDVLQLYAQVAANGSLDGGRLIDALNMAVGANVLVIMPSGNYPPSPSELIPGPPSGFFPLLSSTQKFSVLVAGALNRNANPTLDSRCLLPAPSCFGPSLSIAAPGVNIWSRGGPDPAAPANILYQVSTGSSIAAAQVAGVGACLRAINPTLSASDIGAVLMGTAFNTNASSLPGGRYVYVPASVGMRCDDAGAGRVAADAAGTKANATKLSAITATIPPVIPGTAAGTTRTTVFTITNTGPAVTLQLSITRPPAGERGATGTFFLPGGPSVSAPTGRTDISVNFTADAASATGTALALVNVTAPGTNAILSMDGALRRPLIVKSL